MKCVWESTVPYRTEERKELKFQVFPNGWWMLATSWWLIGPRFNHTNIYRVGMYVVTPRNKNTYEDIHQVAGGATYVSLSIPPFPVPLLFAHVEHAGLVILELPPGRRENIQPNSNQPNSANSNTKCRWKFPGLAFKKDIWRCSIQWCSSLGIETCKTHEHDIQHISLYFINKLLEFNNHLHPWVHIYKDKLLEYCTNLT